MEAGILKGVGDGLLNPEGTLTREMFFVMCARALSIPEEATLSKEFADSSAISDWAKGSIYALINHGHIAGTTSDTVSPNGLMTRGSAMVLMDRMIAAYVTESGTVAVEQDGAVVVLADNVTLTGSADVVVSVYAEDASVSLKGFNGNARVVAQRDGVTVTNAPAGTVIEAAEGVEGTKANGQQLAADSEVVISGGRHFRRRRWRRLLFPEQRCQGCGRRGLGRPGESAERALPAMTAPFWSRLSTRVPPTP